MLRLTNNRTVRSLVAKCVVEGGREDRRGLERKWRKNACVLKDCPCVRDYQPFPWHSKIFSLSALDRGAQKPSSIPHGGGENIAKTRDKTETYRVDSTWPIPLMIWIAIVVMRVELSSWSDSGWRRQGWFNDCLPHPQLGGETLTEALLKCSSSLTSSGRHSRGWLVETRHRRCPIKTWSMRDVFHKEPRRACEVVYHSTILSCLKLQRPNDYIQAM